MEETIVTGQNKMEIRFVIRNKELLAMWNSLLKRVLISYPTEVFRVLIRTMYQMLEEGYVIDKQLIETHFSKNLQKPYEIRIKLYAKEDKRKFNHLLQVFESSLKENKEEISANKPAIMSKLRKLRKNPNRYVDVARYMVIIFHDLMQKGKIFNIDLK